MPINRIAYFAQSGTITPLQGSTYVLPINSANIEVSRPIEATTAFGSFKALSQAQTNVTTCKSSLKGYLGTGAVINGLTNTILDAIVNATQTGTIAINVNPQGFSMTGICTNIGIDISVGGFGMFDLGFAGVGNPVIANAATSATSAVSSTMTLSPATTMSILAAGALANASPTSLKFSYDLPTDTLTSLGENPDATQGSLNSIIATKAPYKSSISVEGFGVNVGLTDLQAASGINIGNIGIVLPTAKVTARSYNNAAGQASATFSYSMDDVTATFSAVSVAAYSQNNAAQSGATWGG